MSRPFRFFLLSLFAICLASCNERNSVVLMPDTIGLTFHRFGTLPEQILRITIHPPFVSSRGAVSGDWRLDEDTVKRIFNSAGLLNTSAENILEPNPQFIAYLSVRTDGHENGRSLSLARPQITKDLVLVISFLENLEHDAKISDKQLSTALGELLKP